MHLSFGQGPYLKKPRNLKTFLLFFMNHPYEKTPLFSPNESDKYDKYGADLVISLNFL